MEREQARNGMATCKTDLVTELRLVAQSVSPRERETLIRVARRVAQLEELLVLAERWLGSFVEAADAKQVEKFGASVAEALLVRIRDALGAREGS